MGQRVDGNDHGIIKTEGSGKPKRSGDSRTGSASDSRGSRGGSGGKTKQTELPKLVAVEVPGEEKEQQPQEKKKRGRPKGSTKKATTPKKVMKTDTLHVELLLTTAFGIIGSRPGLEMFTLSAAEAKQLAEPLTNILAKNDALSSAMNEHGDAVALLTACFMIFVPKFLQYKQQSPSKKKEKKEKKEVKTNVSISRDETRKDSRDRKRDDKQVTSYDETNRYQFGGELHRIAEPATGWGY